MQNNQINQILSGLGLNKLEKDCYLELLKKKPAKSLRISEKT
ncbi:MAG: hypothetical protein PHT51_00210 [Patescibacteria group bacterium]|nr:hypothetical protein [Patescibacteria group bacterium]MDD4610657.1 hypothetical protein [Patescibacteria group bacterium]